MEEDKLLARIKQALKKAGQKQLRVKRCVVDCDGKPSAFVVRDDELEYFLDESGALMGVYDEDQFVDLVDNINGAELPEWADALK